MKRIAAGLIGLASLFGTTAAQTAASQQLIGSYYESFTEYKICSQFASCAISFGAIPVGKTIIIKRVICKTISTVLPSIIYFGPSATSGGSLIKFSYFASPPLGVYSSSYYYGTYETIPDIMVGPSRFPTVFFMTPAVAAISLECSLSGIAI